MVKHHLKTESYLKLAIILVTVVLVNALGNDYFFRIDLTEEKRYTVSEATKSTLGNLDDVVYVECYLDGDLNSEFKQFSRAIRETLEEFRIQSGRMVEYRFVDPLQAESNAARDAFGRELAAKGVIPTDLYDSDEGQQITRRIYPGVLISYRGEEIGVNLLKGNKGLAASEQLNQSVEGVEYEIAFAIRQLAETERKQVALIRGHGELDSLEIADFTNLLLQNYDVRQVNLAQRKDLLGYDVALILKPRSRFTESDKYKIDQFLMRGGSVVFMVDFLPVDMDSIGNEGYAAFPVDLNLRDQLFQYGVRINNNLVQDLNSGFYPVVVGNRGDQPDIRPIPWPYFLLVNRYGNHPITRNLDAVYMRFASTIDTVRADGIRKTPLLYSSVYSRPVAAPVEVTLNSLRFIREDDFQNQQPLPLGYLLEGRFESIYQNRFLPPGVDKGEFLERGQPGKIVVISDGDMVRNEFNFRSNEPFALGFDPVSGNTFANADFATNLMEYLLNEEGIINARNKQIRVRPLDKIRVANDRVFWQVINLAGPLILLLIFGIAKHWFRKLKYARPHVEK